MTLDPVLGARLANALFEAWWNALNSVWCSPEAEGGPWEELFALLEDRVTRAEVLRLLPEGRRRTVEMYADVRVCRCGQRLATCEQVSPWLCADCRADMALETEHEVDDER